MENDTPLNVDKQTQALRSQDDFLRVIAELEGHGIKQFLTFDPDEPEYQPKQTYDGAFMPDYVVVADIEGGERDGERVAVTPLRLVATATQVDKENPAFVFLPALAAALRDITKGRTLSELALRRTGTFHHKQTGFTLAVIFAIRVTPPQ